MRCTVAELQARMSSREFSEWIAYGNVEPWDELARADLIGATIAQTVANFLRDPEAHREPFPITDFIPVFGQTKAERQEEERLYDKALMVLGPFARLEDA